MTEKKVIETQYGWYQKNDNKVNVDEIIGIVKTDEQTNSVQLKKEAQLSICEKRVLELEKENEQLKSTLYYLLNVIQNKCPKDYPKCKEIVRSYFENDSTNSRNDFNNIENEGDRE